MIIQRTLMRKMPFTNIAIRMTGRFLVPLQGIVKVESLIAVRAAEVVHRVVVAVEASRRAEKSVAVPAETVFGCALMVF
jgi:hypothetical protein